MTAKDLFQAGRLEDAIAATVAAVKARPADPGPRGFLCELLCFTGDLARAETHLDALGQQSPGAAAGVAMFRQLLRAEAARQQFFGEGRVPELIEEPGEVLRLHLRASVSLREGDEASAAAMLADAEAARPPVSGTCDGAAFDDLRDLDDLLAPVLEVLTATGKYYWVPLERVRSVAFRPPEAPRDLLWRSATIQVEDGPGGDVYLPAIYPGSQRAEDPKLRVGRATDWVGAPVRGLGQRTLLVGEEARPIMEIKQLRMTPANRPAASAAGGATA